MKPFDVKIGINPISWMNDDLPSLGGETPVEAALAAYDAERRPPTAEIVLTNRRGGPEGVIDVIEARAPGGFDDLDAIAPYAEREAIVRGYAAMAGFAREQVNAR